MKNTNNTIRIRETLHDLLGGLDPVQGGPLPGASAAWDDPVCGCLYRASCFLWTLMVRSPSEALPPFFLTREQRERLQPSDAPVSERTLFRQLNRAAEGNACRPLTGAEMISWMVDQGLFLPFPEDNDLYTLDQKGEKIGLRYDMADGAPVLYYLSLLLSKENLAPIFRRKYDMVFAIPFRV